MASATLNLAKLGQKRNVITYCRVTAYKAARRTSNTLMNVSDPRCPAPAYLDRRMSLDASSRTTFTCSRGIFQETAVKTALESLAGRTLANSLRLNTLQFAGFGYRSDRVISLTCLQVPRKLHSGHQVALLEGHEIRRNAWRIRMAVFCCRPWMGSTFAASLCPDGPAATWPRAGPEPRDDERSSSRDGRSVAVVRTNALQHGN